MANDIARTQARFMATKMEEIEQQQSLLVAAMEKLMKYSPSKPMTGYELLLEAEVFIKDIERISSEMRQMTEAAVKDYNGFKELQAIDRVVI